jgi:hypothetical protein
MASPPGADAHDTLLNGRADWRVGRDVVSQYLVHKVLGGDAKGWNRVAAGGRHKVVDGQGVF